ncbi:hypothetical protein ABK040_005053 [Willaertia magna]
MKRTITSSPTKGRSSSPQTSLTVLSATPHNSNSKLEKNKSELKLIRNCSRNELQRQTILNIVRGNKRENNNNNNNNSNNINKNKFLIKKEKSLPQFKKENTLQLLSPEEIKHTSHSSGNDRYSKLNQDSIEDIRHVKWMDIEHSNEEKKERDEPYLMFNDGKKNNEKHLNTVCSSDYICKLLDCAVVSLSEKTDKLSNIKNLLTDL